MTTFVCDIRSALRIGRAAQQAQQITLAQARHNARERGKRAGSAAARHAVSGVIAAMAAAGLKTHHAVHQPYPFMGLEATFGSHRQAYRESFRNHFTAKLEVQIKSLRGKEYLRLSIIPLDHRYDYKNFRVMFGA